MGEHSGDSLLKVLEQVNVQLGNVTPNVINAWFDTDCEKTRNLLDWLCDSITKDNCITHTETLEYASVERVFVEKDLESKVQSLEVKYPDLFHPMANSLDIEMYQDEIKVLENELEDYKHHININKRLNDKLTTEFTQVSAQEINANLEKETAYRKCNNLAENLDDLNGKLYKQLQRYGDNLNEYESFSDQRFINNIDVKSSEENFNTTVKCLSFILAPEELSLNGTINGDSNNFLTEMQERIFNAKDSYLQTQMEIKHLQTSLDYLKSFKVNEMKTTGRELWNARMSSKYEEQAMLMEMARNMCSKFAKSNVSSVELISAKKGLEVALKNENCVEELKNIFTEVLSHYCVMYSLYYQEQTDLSYRTKILQKVFPNIKPELECCQLRNESMQKTMDHFEKYRNNPIEVKLPLIRKLAKFLTPNQLPNLSKSLNEANHLRSEIKRLEHKHFGVFSRPNIPLFKELSSNADILRKFLMSGLTESILTVPTSLHHILKGINSNLTQQNSSIRIAEKMFQQAKLRFESDKSLQLRSELWSHFISNPQNLLHIVKRSIEEEKKNTRQITGDYHNATLL